MEKAYVHSSGCVKDGHDCLRHEVDSRVPRYPEHKESDGRAPITRTSTTSDSPAVAYIHVNHEHGASAMQVPPSIEHVFTRAAQDQDSTPAQHKHSSKANSYRCRMRT